MQKKLLISPFIVLFLFITHISASAQVEVGARAGLNLSKVNYQYSDGGKVNGTTLTPGFHVGLTFDIPIAQDFYLQPGALFTTKGSKLNTIEALDHFWGDENSMSGDNTVLTPYYLEVPVNFIYKPYMGNGRFLIGAGPYFAYGLGGAYRDDLGGDITKGKLEFINDWNDESDGRDIAPYGKKADAGLNMLVGYEFTPRLSVQLNGQAGLVNIEPNVSGRKPDASMRNLGLGISVGYKF